MFDEDSLDAERAAIHSSHLKTVRCFLQGDDIGGNQRTLGFWAYDFSCIPVETISAIYENFLENENVSGKREDGAYYTPRFLAEMTLDVALEGRTSLTGQRYLDPSCGSGIFLVLVFNRLAAEWTAKHQATAARETPHAYRAKDKALRTALGSLRGVDKNATACRVACFSLYLAFLDQFTPRNIRSYIQQSETNKLPNLLQHQGGRAKKPDIPVIWHGDFFPLAKEWVAKENERFDTIVGNPPWAGRGKKQIAQDFMARTPSLLLADGKAALLLPTKVFFNKTDVFQSRWLRDVTLEKVVQLSDYRFILFTGAICPCLIARFNSNPPAVETHRVEYLTPKVTRVDLRQGAIPIAPSDRKELLLRSLLGAAGNNAATMAWKCHFWGTQQDVKFLQSLWALPKLGDRVDQLSQTRGKRTHEWVAGQGCKPWSLNSKAKPDRELRPFKEAKDKWSTADLFLPPNAWKGRHLFRRNSAAVSRNTLTRRNTVSQNSTASRPLPCSHRPWCFSIKASRVPHSSISQFAFRTHYNPSLVHRKMQTVSSSSLLISARGSHAT
ncbi:MAG: N-6 DNA methylase [Verrucomicrobiaceae bacterium]|nr:N-6 DNA methylase [Verrucomicrobiaceae bacterium]